MPDAIAASVGNGQYLDALQYDFDYNQVVAVGAAAASSTVFAYAYTAAVITSTTNCWYSIGATAVAHGAASEYLPAGLKIKVKFAAGQTISVIQDTLAGYLSITPASNPNFVVLPLPAFDWDFTTGALPGGMTFTRTTTANYFNSAGLLTSAAINAPRFDYDPITLLPRGLLVEPAATNNCGWCRDLTNAIWVKTNITAALTQTGIDGTANTASAITASAANGTALQVLTAGSATRAFSGYVKRLVGSGVVNVTMDGGATWTPITVTAGWTRFSITRTLANPSIGLQIVTSGDSIAIDYTQLELNVTTSPILTTTAAVTRAVDTATLTPLAWFNAAAGTFLGSMDVGTVPAGIGGRTVQLDDGTLNNRFTLRALSAIDAVVVVAGTNTWTAANLIPFPASNVFKDAIAYQSGSPMVQAATGIVNYGSGSNPSAQPTGINRLVLNGPLWVRRVTYWNTRLTDQQLAAATT